SSTRPRCAASSSTPVRRSRSGSSCSTRWPSPSTTARTKNDSNVVALPTASVRSATKVRALVVVDVLERDRRRGALDRRRAVDLLPHRAGDRVGQPRERLQLLERRRLHRGDAAEL